MAKGDVTLKFDANTAQFVQQILKAHDAMEAAADKSRKLGEGVAKMGDKAGASGDMMGKLAGAISLSSIAGSAANLVFAGLTEYLDKMDKRAEGLINRVKQLDQTLAASGQGAASPEIRKKLDAMGTGASGGKEVNPAEVEAIFNSISQAMGVKVSAAEKLKATNVAAYSRAAGIGIDQATEIGKNYAMFGRERKPGGAFEGMKDNELEDIAYETSVKMPGGLDPRQLEILSRSKNKKETLKLFYAAAASEQRSRTLSSIEGAHEDLSDAELAVLKKQASSHNSKHKVEAEEASRRLKLNAIPDAGQTAAMLADPTLAPQKIRPSIKALQEAFEAEKKSKFSTLQGAVNAQRQRIDSGADPNAKMEEDAEDNAARIERITRMNAAEEAVKKNRRDLRSAQIQHDHAWMPKWAADMEGAVGANVMSQGTREDMDRLFGQNEDDLKRERELLNEPDDAAAAQRRADEQRRNNRTPASGMKEVGDDLKTVPGKFKNEANQAWQDLKNGSGTPGPQSRAGDPHLDMLEKINHSLGNIGALQRTRRDTGLRNNSEGQA